MNPLSVIKSHETEKKKKYLLKQLSLRLAEKWMVVAVQSSMKSLTKFSSPTRHIRLSYYHHYHPPLLSNLEQPDHSLQSLINSSFHIHPSPNST